MRVAWLWFASALAAGCNGSDDIGPGLPLVSFAPPVAYAVGKSPSSLAVGDLNGDGKPDLVVANAQSSDLSVLINKGGGAFAPAVSVPVDKEPTSVAIGDLDSDGKPDLVVAPLVNCDVLMNRGDGTFAGAVRCPLNVPWALGIADLNGDGKLDLAAAEPSGDVSVTFNEGDGTFDPIPTLYPVGKGPYSIAIGDLDGNGTPGLATGNGNSGDVSVLLNNGDGSFRAATSHPVGGHPFAIAPGDLNGDGKVDLAVANGTADAVALLVNQGNGTFTGAVDQRFEGTFAVAIGDLDGDGMADLVSSHPLTVQLGIGAGGFTTGLEVDTGACCCNESFAIADLDGDGQPDLATVSSGGTDVLVILNRTLARACAVSSDCASFVCVAGKCVASCDDGTLDGDETDVDCGGAACAACDDEKTCKVPGDCASGGCSAGKCGAPTCG